MKLLYVGPLGFDILVQAGETSRRTLDHLAEGTEQWLFFDERDCPDLAPTFATPGIRVLKEDFPLRRSAEKVASLMADSMGDGYQVGREVGRAEAQRFYRLALGLEAPNSREQALWNNPVPLKGEG